MAESDDLRPGLASAFDRTTSPAATFLMSVRLHSPAVSQSSGIVPWRGNSPVVFLTLDIISSSDGVALKDDSRTLDAKFSTCEKALLAARRLQWALQGLAENPAFHGTRSAIAVHADAEEHDAWAALDTAEPGQILLSNSVASAVMGLPGLTLPHSSEPWQLFDWQQSLTAPNERPVAEFSGSISREAERPAKTQAQKTGNVSASQRMPGPISASTQKVPSGEVANEAVFSGAISREQPSLTMPSPEGYDSIHARIDRDEPAERKSSRMFIYGGAIAAVLLLAGIGITVFHARQVNTPPVTTPGVPPSPQVPPSEDQPKQPPATAEQHPAFEHQPPPTTTQPKAAPVKKVPAEVSGSCAFNEAGILGAFARADTELHAGQLGQARALYQKLVDCPSVRARAREGVTIANQKIAAQGLTDQ